MPNLCGAKTRSGSLCKKAPINGAKRCKFHGGKSTGAKDQSGNKNAAKPGSLYSKFLTEDELALHDQIEPGKVDDELRLLRIRLARELAHEQLHGKAPEIDTTIQRKGGGPNTVTAEVHRKQRDYNAKIDRIMGRIESLERTRIELMKAGAQGGGDTPPDSKTFTYNVVDGRMDGDGDTD